MTRYISLFIISFLLIQHSSFSQQITWNDNNGFVLDIPNSNLNSSFSQTEGAYIHSKSYIQSSEIGKIELTNFELNNGVLDSNSSVQDFVLFFTYESTFSLANVYLNSYSIDYSGVNNTLTFRKPNGFIETIYNVVLNSSDILKIEKIDSNRILLQYNTTEHLISDNYIEEGFIAIRATTNQFSFNITTDGFSNREASPVFAIGSDNKNWIFSRNWDNAGELRSAGINYFDCLARPIQSQTKDLKTGKIWANEIMYDSKGRSALTTLSAPKDNTESSSFSYKENFVLTENGVPFSLSDIETNLERPARTGNQPGTVGNYYSDLNTSEPYQDITNRPYSRTIYDELNPGAVRKVVGGKIMDLNGDGDTNDAEDGFPQGFSYTMPAAQEMQYVFGSDYFPYETYAPGNKIITKFYKTVAIDVHGSEVVSFTDGDGNVLASARSGGTQQYEVMSIIGEQGYVDVHIPVNSSGWQFFGNTNALAIYNLRSGELIGQNEMAAGNIYRIEATPGSNMDAVYINSSGNIEAPLATGISYNVNYYDYALNYYDDAGRLKSSSQPLGFNVDCISNGSIQQNVSHSMKSSYAYNAAGELLTTSSPDEGAAIFRFREDGQIRYSRNSKQLDAEDFSYTTYDNKARPVESGVYFGDETTYVPGTFTASLFETDGHVEFTDTSVSKNDAHGWTDSGFSSTETTGTGNFRISFNLPKSRRGVIGVSETNIDGSRNTVEYGIHYYNNVVSIIRNGVYSQKNTTSYHYNDQFSIERVGDVLYFKKGSEILDKDVLPNDSNGNQVSFLIDGTLYTGANNIISNILIEIGQNFVAIDVPTPLPNIDADLDPQYCKEQVFTEYDIPDTNGLHALLYPNGTLFGEVPRVQEFVSGNVSKTYTKNPETSTTWYSYDVYGRVTWMVQFINNLGIKTIDYEYDDATGVISKVIYQKGDPLDMFVHRYTYNYVEQLERIETSRDDQNFIEHANYVYYETGALKRVNLAEGLQGTDYVYTLSGQLKAINHSSLLQSDDPGNDQNDAFGLVIDYYEDDYSRNVNGISSTSSGTNRYDGNIKATRWGTESLDTNNGFVYQYNDNKWLTSATFGSFNGNTFNEHANGDYKVFNIGYDANGNIATLNRNKHQQDDGNAMDKLKYNYIPNTNQLDHVDDTSGNNYDHGDITQQLDSNYVYNSIGQLIENKLEGLIYSYYANGLVKSVVDTDNSQKGVFFFYDDRGHRVSKKVHNGIEWLSETLYARDASGQVMGIYTKPLNTTLPQEEIELPIYGLSRLGVATPQNVFKYQLTDHLGNVRAVIQRDGAVDPVILFEDFSSTVPNWQTSSNVTLSVGQDERLKVTSTNNSATNLIVPITVEAAHSYAVRFDVNLDETANNLYYYANTTPVVSGLTSGNVADDNDYYEFNFTATVTGQMYLHFDLEDTQASLSNNYSVDNVKITDVTTANAPVMLARKDYYPFGMPMPERNDEGEYRYAFQGQEKDTETGMEAFELRLWDARLGRWLTTDPAGEFYSPYLGMANNPVSAIDPDGGCTSCIPPEVWVDLQITAQHFANTADLGVVNFSLHELQTDDVGAAALAANLIVPPSANAFKNSIPNSIDNFNLKSFHPSTGYTTLDAYPGKVFEKGTDDALKQLGLVKSATGLVATIGNYAGYSTAAFEFIEGNYTSSAIEGASARIGLYIGASSKLGGWISGLGWSAGWEGGRAITNTESYNRQVFGIYSKPYLSRAFENQWDIKLTSVQIHLARHWGIIK